MASLNSICQGKDSSNYSAEDMGCILGTKSEKVFMKLNLFLHFVVSMLPYIDNKLSGWSKGKSSGRGGEGSGRGGGYWKVQTGYTNHNLIKANFLTGVDISLVFPLIDEYLPLNIENIETFVF